MSEALTCTTALLRVISNTCPDRLVPSARVSFTISAYCGNFTSPRITKGPFTPVTVLYAANVIGGKLVNWNQIYLHCVRVFLQYIYLCLLSNLFYHVTFLRRSLKLSPTVHYYKWFLANAWISRNLQISDRLSTDDQALRWQVTTETCQTLSYS